jgi:hypothetical protein
MALTPLFRDLLNWDDRRLWADFDREFSRMPAESLIFSLERPDTRFVRTFLLTQVYI